MKIDTMKLDAALAEAMKSPRQIESVSKNVVYKALRGEEITHRSLGKLAAELGVRPIELLMDEHGGEKHGPAH